MLEQPYWRSREERKKVGVAGGPEHFERGNRCRDQHSLWSIELGTRREPVLQGKGVASTVRDGGLEFTVAASIFLSHNLQSFRETAMGLLQRADVSLEVRNRWLLTVEMANCFVHGRHEPVSRLHLRLVLTLGLALPFELACITNGGQCSQIETLDLHLSSRGVAQHA